MLWPFFFCCLFTVVFQAAELQAVPYVCLYWSISVSTGALQVLQEQTCSLVPIFPPASLCTSCKLCISKSHSWSSLGLPLAAGASHLFLFPLAVSHLFQCLVTFWCRELSLSAEVSWVLGGLIHSLYIHTPGSFQRDVSNPFPWGCVCPSAACCGPQHLAASEVFCCVS